MNRAMRDDFGVIRIGDRCFEAFRNVSEVCPQCENDQLVDEQGRSTGIHTWEGFNPVKTVGIYSTPGPSDG
jgi:hypothetical protein